MRTIYPSSLVLTLAILVAATSSTAAPPLWEQLVPKKTVPADPNGDYTLKETNGPWLVMATSFTGSEGEQQAQELVRELRSRYHLPAYYYGMTFEMDNANPGRGINNYGGPIKRRYSRGDSVEEHAVLVGEFPSVDDSEAQEVLRQIKHITPESLQVDDGEQSAQSMATLRQLQNSLREKINRGKRGPMGHAFLTRNPMLPREYFVPQGVDAEVAKWNEGVEYSLLNCPGKYSIRVATFRGRSIFQMGGDTQEQTRKAEGKDPLVEAANNAHLMTLALRQKGWEAYEFHDRNESFVAVGSFDTGEELADGRISLTDREAQIIANTFGAHSPNNVFERPAPQDKQLEELQKQRFSNLFSQGHGQIFQGLHPKRFVGLPLDIFPEPVRVPKQSISSAYARN